jgi:hypothetical protein
MVSACVDGVIGRIEADAVDMLEPGPAARRPCEEADTAHQKYAYSQAEKTYGELKTRAVGGAAKVLCFHLITTGGRCRAMRWRRREHVHGLIVSIETGRAESDANSRSRSPYGQVRR